MKTIISKSIVLIIFLLLVIFGFWGFYAYHFQGGLSSDQLRWSQFGDFFNGVISPIFAAINIYLFWYLTRVIDLKNERRQREIQFDEKRRQEQNAEHEKALILMQFRKAEIDRFDDAIPDRLLVMPTDQDSTSLKIELMLAASFLINFRNTKLGVFGLDKDSKIGFQVHELGGYILDYNNYLVSKDKEQKSIIENITDYFRKIIHTKNDIITGLQKITLGENI